MWKAVRVRLTAPAGVMPKGILSDDFGGKFEQSRWVIGGIDFPMDPIDFVSRPVPDGVKVEYAGKDVDLGDMLEAGEIDALGRGWDSDALS